MNMGHKKTENKYHYTECGLESVYLVNGFQLVETPSGRKVSITDIKGLHKAIGQHLVEKKPDLTGRDLRFLRHEMLMSQITLARLLGVSEQAVRRWEQGKTGQISKPTETLIRMLYTNVCGDGDTSAHHQLRDTLQKIADLENHINRVVFDSKDGWKPVEYKEAA